MSVRYFGGFVKAPTNKETNHYMRGECAYLALALNSLLKESILMEVAGRHFLVKDGDGFYWDIRGRMDVQQVKDGMVNNWSEHPVSRDDVLNILATGIYSDGPYVPHREKQAKSLLRNLLPRDLNKVISRSRQQIP